MSADNEVEGDSKTPSCTGCCCCCHHKHQGGHTNGDATKKSTKKGKKAKKANKADANGTTNGTTNGTAENGGEGLAAKTDAGDGNDDGDDDDDDDDDDTKSAKSGDEAEGENGEEKKPLPPVGSVVEVKNIYRSPKDDDGEWTWQTEEPTDIEEAAENEETGTYVLVVRNRKSQDSRKKLEADSIVVQSPLLRVALAEILKDYTGVACELKRLIFDAPFAPFVHRWADLIAYRDKPDLDPVLKSHVDLLHGVLQYEIGDSIKAVDDYVNNAVITYEHLWMIFQPGAIVLSAFKGPVSGFELVETEYGQNQCGKFLSVRCDCVDYSGKDFGRFREEIRIPEFIGTKKITGLKVYPWLFHPDREKAALQLTTRGQLFEKLAGHHYKAYSGKAITWDREGNEQPIQVTGRIVVDIDSFNRFSPYSVRYTSDWTARDQERLSDYKAKVEKDRGAKGTEQAGVAGPSADENQVRGVQEAKETHLKGNEAKGAQDTTTVTENDQKGKQDISQPKTPESNTKGQPDSHRDPDTANKDDNNTTNNNSEDTAKDDTDNEKVMLTPYHHMLCRSRTRGYSLKIKEWLDFYVEQVEEISWNTDAFDRLVLPDDQKELIMAFSESQLRGTSSFDDFIVGKGKGIICLLSGPPGVGKTLTAEALAESLQVPLHTLSSGDLGSHAWEVETGLQRILELVSRWNAILLLDECDVFLEERTSVDLERNKVISIFLRTLEYYEGIMFMTTNRVENIDLAFQSRIHVSIEYPDLTTESRRTIWRNFVSSSGGKPEVFESDIAELAQLSLNGRQIKNVLKTAGLLALRKRMPLRRSFIDTVLTIEKKRPGVNNTYTAQLYT